MYAYVRSSRYHLGGSHQLARDLARTVQLDEEIREADMWLSISDNGGGYNLDSQVLHFLYGRLWRQTQKALLTNRAFHAGGSQFNSDIEQQWSQPRNRSKGREYGKTSVADADKPFEGFATVEEGLQHISDHAMREYAATLQRCKTGGEPWHVEAPTQMDFFEDWEKIKQMLSQTNQKGLKDPQFADLLLEHRDHARHMCKTPSEVSFYMCCNDNPCAECTDVIKKRQEKQPGWHPRKVLRLLEWNNFRLPHTELADEALYPPLPPAPAPAADAPVVDAGDNSHSGDGDSPEARAGQR